MSSLLLSLLLIVTYCVGPLCCLPGSDEVPSRTDLFGKGVVRQDLKTLGAHMNAESVATALRKFTNKELGVPIMQAIVDGLSFNKVVVNTSAIVSELVAKLNETFDIYGKVLRNARDAVQTYYGKHPMDMQVFRPFKECCRLRSDELRYDVQYGSRVNLSFACDIVSPPSEQPQFLFYPGKSLTTMYQHNAATLSGLRWQYFISSAGSHMEYPAHSFDPLGPLTGTTCLQREMIRHRAPYLSSAVPYPKRVVILIDYGSAVSDSQLLKIQAVGKTLLESFSSRDRVTVLAMSSKVLGPCGSELPDLLDPTSDAKEALGAFIDSLNRTEERTNHSLGLEEAYKVLIHAENSLSRRPSQDTVHNFIMYVSRGLLTSLAEAGVVLSTVANLNVNTYISVQINSFAIVDSDKTPLLWAGQFLRDVAEQNFQKYRHSLSQQLSTKLKDSKIDPPKGKTIVVDDNESRSVTLTKVFESLKTPEAVLEPSYRTLMSWSTPLNELGNPVVSVTMPVWHKDDFVGVVGHDLNLNAIADGLKYADLPDNSKARVMLIDLDGRVLVDSRLRDGFSRPVSVADLEGWTKTDRWKANFASDDVFEGSFDLTVPAGDTNATRTVSYTWKKIESAPFVVLLASEMRPRVACLERRSTQTLSLRKVVYHRLDLQLNSDIRSHCTHMDQLSTIERGSVYLGPSCFSSPHAHMTSDKNTRSKQATRASGYWVYLGDGAGLIRNTGVRPGVREDVGALAAIVDEWQQRFISSPNQKHILRRFVATNRGVLVTFPATVFTDDFDPTERHWYKRALQYPGRIVLTGPYLDSSAGDIVTISHTVYEGEGGAMHMPEDQVFAVMAMDVSVDFIFKVLYDTLPVCRQSGRRCIMFEDTGYLVGRGDPLLNLGNRSMSADMNANPLYAEREPIEGGHLTHREPSLAIHLLQNAQFMRKTTCKQFTSQTTQRLYQFNTSYTDAIRMTGDSPSGCTRSEVTPVPRTNTFLVVLDHTCDVQTSVQSAFCPCSVSDRRCLLCSRIDPLECECPCECPIRNSGAQCSTDEIVQSPVCAAPEPPNVTPSSARDPNLFAKLAALEGADNDKHLVQCVPIRCEQHTTIDKCLGVLGCQWCLRAEDGRRLLVDPFCSPIDQCFGGIRGRSIQGYRYDDEVLSAISTPVGPVAGAIMGVFVLLVIAVYCYRHQVTRLVESRVSAGSGVRLYPTADDDDDEFHFDHDGSKVDADEMGRAPIGVMQLASFERNSIPRAQYRPGPRTESSDHGYSTMTDRMAGDESERGTTIDLGAAPLCKPRPSRSYRIKDKSDSGAKLLVDEEAESAIDSNNDDDQSAASAPTGQTSLNDSSFCESRLVITTADVHAVEA